MPDQTSAITALIANGACCRECIATNVGLPPEAVDAAIAVLSRALKIDRYHNGMCLACGETALVFVIDRPPRR